MQQTDHTCKVKEIKFVDYRKQCFYFFMVVSYPVFKKNHSNQVLSESKRVELRKKMKWFRFGMMLKSEVGIFEKKRVNGQNKNQ